LIGPSIKVKEWLERVVLASRGVLHPAASIGGYLAHSAASIGGYLAHSVTEFQEHNTMLMASPYINDY